MFDIYDVCCTDFKDQMDFVPYQEFNATSDQRCWEDFMSGNWAWDEVVCTGFVSINNPLAARATLVPIILGSDKTTVSIATGQMDYYLLYLSIRNVHNTTHHAHCNVVHANTQVFHKFKKQLLHLSLAHVLWSLGPVMTVLEIVLFSNQYYQHVIYALAAYIADYEEQVLLSCIMHNWCPKCLTHQENLDKDALWHHWYGIDGDIVPFTSMFLHVNIQRMLSPDILHQLIKGGFKDHLVDWVERYLIHIHGKGQHFKQWTGDDSKGLMKVYIAAIKGYAPEDIICTSHAFLKFCYLVCQNVITEPMLTTIEDTLTCFHLYHEVFQNAQQHAIKHYPYLICQFSTLNGLCSSITESKHIKAVKRPYWHTSHFQALGQMLVINQRLDKFAAVCADFKKCGMLRGTCLSHVLGTLECMHERNMRDLVTELNIPQLLNILCHFLQLQLQHDDHNLEDVPLDEYPFYDGSFCVYNSASSTFYAPSDVSGLHGMHHKHIHCSPMWRNEGPHYDCVFVVTDPHAEGMLGLDVACVLCFFSQRDGPDTNTGMWIVCTHNAQDVTIIHINTIYHTAQLIPIYVSHQIDPASIKPNKSYDKFFYYYVNRFADHHAFEIAS
ncbi:hypothetical protein F5J12DRAFT_905734 [Pisolithus orientalis]|uniref:uncharacterized protein n=1 Tax=Pisolithus orientalis TaxID=936130 RepID=UPI0022249B8F|nr:uncharacterized protein F5J12DRAFT_905734 [Pisolithus orientalis]KAI6006244.1 hypothetical protein F5J12DRAFT_905734 [Pisolithus orientalis]